MTESHSTKGPSNRSLNFIFPTKSVTPQTLKLSHWLRKESFTKYVQTKFGVGFLEIKPPHYHISSVRELAGWGIEIVCLDYSCCCFSSLAFVFAKFLKRFESQTFGKETLRPLREKKQQRWT